jgi:pyrroline-5-carboxylate reductase
MLQNKTIAIIGAGNMGEALAQGLIESAIAQPQQIICTDIRAERLDQLQKCYGLKVDQNNLTAVGQADIVLYAVKPQVLADVLEETASGITNAHLLISVVAGVPMTVFEKCLGQTVRLVRVMPNIAAAVKAAASAIVPGAHASKEDIAITRQICEVIGRAVVISEESLMDAVTGLSGSGPGYVFVIIEALADAGVNVGLARAEALQLAAQTVLGAAQLYLHTQKHPGALKDLVTSPGGTTIAGLHALEKGGVRGVIYDTVEAATRRSQKLGEQVRQRFR